MIHARVMFRGPGSRHGLGEGAIFSCSSYDMKIAVTEGLKNVRERIRKAAERSGRDPKTVRLVAVTKNFGPERVQEAVDAGADLLGENRVQEALSKMDRVHGGVSWHMIGHLQKNKVRSVVGRFDLIHSADSPGLAEEINRRAEKAGLIQKILIQVNLSGETSKHGVDPGELDGLVDLASGLPHIKVEGLMVIPPLSSDPEDSRPLFRGLAERFQGFREAGHDFHELSMGMSNDFEVAVEEGATLVRVGTAIFGSRE
ncbi:MAG TPA: YggS family pyridoxal phosphate-dependent enzyme [Nitrospiria bacterium]